MLIRVVPTPVGVIMTARMVGITVTIQRLSPYHLLMLGPLKSFGRPQVAATTKWHRYAAKSVVGVKPVGIAVYPEATHVLSHQAAPVMRGRRAIRLLGGKQVWSTFKIPSVLMFGRAAGACFDNGSLWKAGSLRDKRLTCCAPKVCPYFYPIRRESG